MNISHFKILLTFTLFFFSLLPQSCSAPLEECVDLSDRAGVSENTLDTSESLCKKNCECNNLFYEGRCIKGKCNALKREDCTTKGIFRSCISQYTECKQGTQICSPDSLKGKMKWSDCLCGCKYTKCPKDQYPDTEAKCECVDIPECKTCTTHEDCEPDDNTPPDEKNDIKICAIPKGKKEGICLTTCDSIDDCYTDGSEVCKKSFDKYDLKQAGSLPNSYKSGACEYVYACLPPKKP